METKFTKGKSYYTRNGQKVEFLEKTSGGRFVVATVIEVLDWEGSSHEEQGQMIFVDELFPSPPREVIDADILSLREERSKLQTQCTELKKEAIDAESDVRRRLKALSKYKGLERIEDFVEGRITHAVLKPGYALKLVVMPIKDALSHGDREHDMKLVSLFGKSNGDLEWRLNRYSDGSGSYREIYLCTSEQEAVNLRNDMVQNWFAEVDVSKPHTVVPVVMEADRIGLDVPDNLRRIYQESRQNTLKKTLEDAASKLSEYSKIEAKARAELTALAKARGEA